MFAAIWHFMVAGLVIFVVARMVDGVRCRGYLDAVKVALLYSLINSVLMFVVALLGFGPAVFTALMIPFLGAAAVFVVAVIVGFLVSCVSLYLADQVVEGFEIKSFGTTMLVCFLIGVGNLVLARFGAF